VNDREPAHHPTIRGVRTTLRPTTPADVDLLSDWLADPEVYRWWGGAPVARAMVAEQYVGVRQPDVETFVVETDGQPIGFLQYWRGEPRTGGLDVFLIPTRRGQGLGPDAARAVVSYLVDELGWQRVTVDPSVDNAGAIRAWERAGFQFERAWPEAPDGPAILMAIDVERTEDRT
jgi:aminoglycoside 6'-N-acetyltransferase